MANFNTNQVRHFYVAKDYKAAASSIAAAGDIAVGVAGKAALGADSAKQLFFTYKNGDGILTRSDLIPAKNIAYVNKATAASMNRYLTEHVITVDSNISSLLANKRIALNVLIRELVDLDPRSSFPVVASVKVGSTVVASDIYKNLALALAKALPTFGNPDYPFFKVFVRAIGGDTEVTRTTAASSLDGTYTAIVVIATAQKWRRGLMNNGPVDLVVSFTSDADIEGAWGIDTIGTSASLYIASAFALADEEWFCYGERGDEARGYNYPNNVEPTYLINPFDSATTYDVMTIQYFYQGPGEDVQKSQKTIRIAAPHDDLESIYTDFCLKAGIIAPEEGVTGISLNKTTLSLAVGADETLVATLFPEEAAGTITWASSAAAKASVDTSGKVTGVASGTANITATCNGKTATCAVTVA